MTNKMLLTGVCALTLVMAGGAATAWASSSTAGAARKTGAVTTVSDSQTTGTGSLTVVVTSPVSRDVTLPAQVACTVGAHSYRMLATSRTVRGLHGSLALTVPAYSAPGSYQAAVTGSVTGSDGTAHVLPLKRTVPVVITSTGGSAHLHATTHRGRTIDATATWICPDPA